MYKIISLLLFTFFILNLNAQTNYKKSFRDWLGRREFKKEYYEDAEKHFQQNSIENPNIGQLHFNRGTALYKTENYEEAQREFQIALNDNNFTDRDQIFHNMGNIAFNTGEYEEALDFFRRALIENPDNMDSRINFELTRQIMQQSQQESSGEGESDENEDQQQQQQQQQQQNQEQDQDKEEAERLLQAIEQLQEQEREREQQTPGQRRGRFW